MEILGELLQFGRGVGHVHGNHADTGKLALQRGLMCFDIGIVEPDTDPAIVGPIDPNIPKAVEGLGEHSHFVDRHLVTDIDGGVGVPVLGGVRRVDVLAGQHLHRGPRSGRGGARLWLHPRRRLGAGSDGQKQHDNCSDSVRLPHDRSTPVDLLAVP